jgi:hypothetical protein
MRRYGTETTVCGSCKTSKSPCDGERPCGSCKSIDKQCNPAGPKVKACDLCFGSKVKCERSKDTESTGCGRCTHRLKVCSWNPDRVITFRGKVVAHSGSAAMAEVQPGLSSPNGSEVPSEHGTDEERATDRTPLAVSQSIVARLESR